MRQLASNPVRIPPTIEHRMNENSVVFHAIVDCKWKSPGSHPIITELLCVNTGIKMQGFDVGHHGIDKVATYAFRLLFVEPKTVKEILFRPIKDLDPHWISFWML
jgi:hypothetical protein